MVNSNPLRWPDYLIFAGFIVISLAIGVYHALTGGRQRTTQEFITADRKLKVLPTSMSLLVSFVSAIGILSFTSEMYMHGPQFVLGIGGKLIGILIAERFLVPWLYPLKLTSVNEVSVFQCLTISNYF